MTIREEKSHQQVRGKILKAVDVKVLPGDQRRLYQERVGRCVVAQDSYVRKADEEQEEEILGNLMKVSENKLGLSSAKFSTRLAS